MVILFGIKNCDAVKKAKKWLQDHGIDHRFHDFKTDGLTRSQLMQFSEQLGWEPLLNRNSSSWRQLDASQRLGMDAAKALELMLETPTLVKRPVMVKDDRTVIGFQPGHYAAVFGLIESEAKKPTH